MQTEDGSIIQKCLNGEPAAFGILVDKYKAGIYAFVYDKLRNFHDAQDVTQEVFERAYRNLRSLRRWESFAFWLYRIASNQCKRWFQIRSRCPDSQFIEDQCQSVLEKPSLDAYRDSQKDGFLQEALDSLSETYREVLILHYFGGMTIKDMARAIGASPTAVEKRLSRARAQLRKEMIAMMDTAFEGQRLQASFTFRVVEAIKRVKINPVSQPRGLPWGISFATGLLATVLSLSPYINMSFTNPADIPASSPLPAETKALKVGEIPVDVVKTSNVSILSSNMGKGKSGGPKQPEMENAFFMAPQGEGEWVKRADMPTARSGLCTVVVNGKIYAIGGIKKEQGEYIGLSSVEEYDPIGNKWEIRSSMLSKRTLHCACSINGKIYVAGGWDGTVGAGEKYYTSVHEYDPILDKWTAKNDMPEALYNSAFCTLDSRMYVFGGRGHNLGGYDLVYEYDPAEDSWTEKANMPSKKWAMQACPVNGKIYVIGGVDGNLTTWLTVEEYDPTTDTWKKKSDMPTARVSPACVVGAKIYVMGGTTSLNVNGQMLSTVDIYDPLTDTWTKGVDMQTSRRNFSASVVGGKIYCIGGIWPNAGEVVFPDVEEFDTGFISVDPSGKLPTTWGSRKSSK